MLMYSTMMEPAMTHRIIAEIGFKKSHLKPLNILILGTLAGIYIGFGCQLMVTIVNECPLGGICKYIGGLGFSTGLMLIVCAGAELFTGNCLLMIAVLAKRIFLTEMLIDWAMVWLSNFFGSILVSAIMFGGKLNGYDDQWGTMGSKYCAIVLSKSELEPQMVFFRGILCNILVCLAVLMAASTRTLEGKVLACLFPIGAFVGSGYEHSIANMSFFAMGTFLKCPDVNHGRMWLNLLMSTVGNIVGAGLLSVAYWAVSVKPSEDQAEHVPEDPKTHVSITPQEERTMMSQQNTPPPDPGQDTDNEPVK